MHIQQKILYELLYNKTSSIKYFMIFGCKVYILNMKDNVPKFSSMVNEGIFVGYATSSRGYRIYNKKIFKIEETANVTFSEDDSTKTNQRTHSRN